LPDTLDETYERVLKDINKANQKHAIRLLHCLTVAIRPLLVDELAEILAVDFDAAQQGGIPKLNPNWRWEDHHHAVLSTCSSLIMIVDKRGSQVVQFSHFSVKEFLTSSRLSMASGEVSAYRIDLENAHKILAQACLAVLLQTHDEIDGNTSEDHPLVIYAAEHWTTHAQFGEVSSRAQKGMEYLFNPDKPHFNLWLTLYDIDTDPHERATLYWFAEDSKDAATPLYYAAFCGFHSLVQHLIVKYPQDVNTDGGYYMRPVIAALAGEHFQTADLLRRNGADPHVQGRFKSIPMHSAASMGNLDVVQKLIEYDADVDAVDEDGWTPLYWASMGDHFKDGSVLRLLLGHGADINAQDEEGRTPLISASNNGRLEIVRLLLKSGADVEVKDNMGKTALQVATEEGYDEIAKLLREHGAKLK